MAEAVTVYATRAELVKLSVPPAGLAGISAQDQDDALRAASRTVDSYLTARFQLPLSQVGEDVTQVTCDIAAYRLLKRRGFRPDSADAEQYRLAYADAIKWLEGVAKGNITPTDLVTAAGPEAGTDEAGEAAAQARPFALQYREEQPTEAGFFRRDEEATGYGLGKPRRRGW